MTALPVDHPPANTGADPPPRRETFLARYPRKLKIGALAGLLVVLGLLISFLAPSSGPKSKTKPAIATVVSGADSRAAIANQAPALVPGTLGVDRPADTSNQTSSGETTTEAEESNNVFMAPAPDPGLVDDTPLGALPRISEDGRQPWQVYARPFNAGDKRPRIAIVITDLGMSRVASDSAIDRLPPAVTLAFDVQSPVVGAWCARARQAGHETLLMLPMEPFDYPRSDPGPNTLLSNLPNSDNLQRLQWALMQASGYVGVTTLSGTRFTTDPDRIKPVLETLRKRGLMVFDARIAPHSAIADLAHEAHVPVAINTQRIDQNLAPAALDEALSQIEQTARLTGRAVAMAPPVPLVIDRLGPWVAQLHHDGIALAPLSAMAQ